MKKKVFIIGNGFDLDLGWKTGYKDFFQSDYCPIHPVQNGACPMEDYLSQKTKVGRWYDLECVLREYASVRIGSYRKAPAQDEVFFNELRGALTSYIKQETLKDINADSMAVRVLKAIVTNGYFTSIYTFNYTNPCDMAKKAGITTRFDFKYVHGSVERNSIILGVDDKSELREGYGYMRKVFSEHYSSNPIRYDLQECDEVVFFGHSLGDMDYPYFRDFFYTQSHCNNRKDGKRITIFTKDNHSRLQLLEQLRQMNEGQTEHLQNDNDFNIVMTDNPDEFVLKQFFEHLGRDSVATRNAKLSNLASML